MRGYDNEYIAEFLHWTIGNTEKVFNDACKIIKEQNDYDWQRCLETSGTIKIPNEVKYKRCTKCEKDLILNENNFEKRFDNYGDGFRPDCRKCNSRGKKTHKNS